MRILYIEENINWQTVIQEELILLGHKVVTVDNIPAAKKLLDSKKFNAVICAPNLERKGDGVQFANELFAQEKVKVVLVPDNGHVTVIPKSLFDVNFLLKAIS